jgi:RNA polymerase sigma-70 factor (ECF subfamily)
VFRLLYQELPKFTDAPTKSFRAWLWTILLNQWRDGQRRRALLRMEGRNEALAEQPVSDNVAAFTEDEYREYLVNRALQLMRADFQPATWQACWEHVVCGRPATEVAQEFGLTVDAIYAANYRVLRRLRQELEGLLS